MGYTNEQAGDFEKLKEAFRELTSTFGSFDNLLEAFGLSDMPQAQRYGIMFGLLVFTCTVTTVVALLVFGGSFQRIAEQAESGSPSLLSPTTARSQRALLYEQLLEGRKRMLQNYPPETLTTEPTNLTKMLLSDAPDGIAEVADLVAGKKTKNAQKKERYIPPYYEENYLEAYRRCQDRPGGSMLAGKPEARFEAYARGYAGCGPYTTPTYRRSYGRLYEATCCASDKSEERYSELFRTRPYDIVGRHCRLEALDVKRHLKDVFTVTSGMPALEKAAYEPEEVWSFLEDGPFESPDEMSKSFVFQRKRNEAGFAIVHSVTESVLGVVLLTHDDPANLTIQIEPPIMQLGRAGSSQELEACFLLMDRLFALGYRRIQIMLDSQDSANRKLVNRLGFTMEGVLCKHLILKESSRDSNVYGLLNSDWKKGARSALFTKLYGAKALSADKGNESTEAELAEQQRALEKQKRLAAKKLE